MAKQYTLSENDRQLLAKLRLDVASVNERLRRTELVRQRGFIWGIRMDRGPNNETDYSDEIRIWFKSVVPSNTGDTTELVTWQELDSAEAGYVYSTATNIGLNYPEVNQVVQVYEVISPDSETIERYECNF